MAWFNVNWPYRNKFTINNAGQGALTNFPVTINVIPGSGRYIRWDLIDATGKDIRFTDSDGTTILNHEIERLDRTLNTLVAHVKIPTLASGVTNQALYMYYGNGKATDQGSAFHQATWDDNFIMVHHMDQRAQPYTDSTANSINVVNSSGTPTYTNRYVGFRSTVTGCTFDCKKPAALTDLTDLTVEAIVQQSSTAGLQCIVDKSRGTIGAPYNATKGWYLISNGGKAEFYRDFDGAVDGKWIASAATWAAGGAPHHVAVTYNKSAAANVPIIYSDGAAIALTATNTPSAGSNAVTDASYSLRYCGTALIPKLAGWIDEIRISNSIRSADWIKATTKSLMGRMVSKANALEFATPSGSVTSWWDSNWAYRKKISSDAGAYAYVSGQHFMRVRVDTASLVSAGKLNAGLDDLRIVRQIPSGLYECPRYIASGLSPAWVYWPCAKSLASGVDIGAEATVHYYMYYGNINPGALKTWYNYNCPQAPWSIRKKAAQTASGWYDRMHFKFNDPVGTTFFRDYADTVVVTNKDYRASGSPGVLSGEQGRLETSVYIPGNATGKHILIRNRHYCAPSGTWMIDFWYKPRQLNATNNYIFGQWMSTSSNWYISVQGKASKGAIVVTEAATNIMSVAASPLVASSGKWYFHRFQAKIGVGGVGNTRRQFLSASGTWGKKTHYTDNNETGTRLASSTSTRNLYIGALYNGSNVWQANGFDGWIENVRITSWPGDLNPSGLPTNTTKYQWTKPWVVSSELINYLNSEEAYGPGPGPSYNDVPWARMGGYSIGKGKGSGIAQIGGYIDCMGHPVPVGRVGGYLLCKSLQHAYGAGILGGYTEGLINTPTRTNYIGGYISSVHKTDVPWALMGGIASGLRNREGYIGAYIVAHPAEVKYVEQRDRTLVKANSEQTIGQNLNIDSVVTFKGVNSTDFYALFNLLNTYNAEFKAKTKVVRYKRPPTVQITSVSPNTGGLVNGARKVTVTATGSLVDGKRWTHAYIDFGDPVSKVIPLTYTNNASISGFSATKPVWTASHDYHESGVYKIVVRAQDDYGMIGTDVSGVNLTQGLVPGVDYPLVSISATPRSGVVPTSLQVDFNTITSGTAPNGGIGSPGDERIFWNFGNREGSQLKNPVTHYNSPGLYAPTLRYRYVNPSGQVIWVQDTLLLGYNV